MCIFALLMFNTITLILINEYLKDSDKCNSAGWRSHGPDTTDTDTVWGDGDMDRVLLVLRSGLGSDQ